MALKKITPNDEINPSPYNDTDTVLGIDLIDRDHSKIIDILNSFETTKFTPEQYIQTIEVLEDYVVSHFMREEEFMKLIGYPRYQSHLKQHRQFLEAFEGVWKTVSKPNSKDIQEFMAYIKDWWGNHIKVEDRRYAEWIRTQLNARHRSVD